MEQRLINANELLELYKGLEDQGLKIPVEVVIQNIKDISTAYEMSKIKEMEEEIKEFKIQTGLMRKRTYYNKFVKEVFQKEKGSDLVYPDFDEIYKRYFELVEHIAGVVKRLEECKTKKYVTGITHNLYELGACHAMDDVIEIVKGGKV